MAPNVEPQPSTSNSPSGGPKTSTGAMSAAIPLTLLSRNSVMSSWLAGSYSTLPVLSACSSPPIRCSRPGVPGIAHGRDSVSGSLSYGRYGPSSSVGGAANGTLMSGRLSTSGSSQGSEPLAM